VAYKDARMESIKQVVAGWCFMEMGARWSIEVLCKIAKSLGCHGVELVGPEHWGILKKSGLICALTRSHRFVRGMNNPNHWPECIQKLDEAINATSAAGFPNVITFTGFGDTSHEENGSVVSAEVGMRNCIEGYKKVVKKAEKKKVTLVLECLNTRVTENMKGHPGYQGDHADYCLEIIKRVGSPSLRLLFDVYHIQIMDGDLIRRIYEFRDYIGHVHVAGNPGRGEIGAEQEINYSAVMRALAGTGYKGYVGHEWIPTGDPLKGLKEAIGICNVKRSGDLTH
jgi:hydroxypyruvate isomerase